MVMLPFDPEMYPDDVTFHRHDPATSGMGASRRLWLDPVIAMKASVQSEKVDRTDAAGRSYTTLGYAVYTPTDPQAVADDKFEWRGRTLTVEGATDPKGIGGVTWVTHCVESR